MINKRIYLIIFVVFWIISTSLPIVVSEIDKGLISYQKHDNEYYWFSICIVIGTFDEKRIDNTSYINKYVTNQTNGILFGILRDNENLDETTLRFFCIRNMTV
jgi:hypothetical protein